MIENESRDVPHGLVNWVISIDFIDKVVSFCAFKDDVKCFHLILKSCISFFMAGMLINLS